MSINLGSAYGKVTLDSSGVKRGVDQGISSLQTLHTKFQAIGSSLSQIGGIMTAAFTVPIVLAGKKAFDVYREFEQSLNVLKTVSGATTEEMKKLSDEARKLGADLTLPGTSAADAAEAMAELAKAGLDVNEILAATRGVLLLSVAGQLSNAEAARVAANALNAFHLEGSEAVRVTDLLAAAALASTAEVKEMADSLQMVAAVANMSGMTLDETITSLALLANAGIQGSDAGTSLKQMLLSLETPSIKAKKIMRELGIEIYDAAGNMKSMRELIVEFGSKMKGLTQEERNFALGIIFGSDAIRASSIVLLGGAEAYDTMSTSVNKAGAAAGLAAAMMEGLTGSMENIKSAFDTAAIAAIEPFKDSLKVLLDFVAKALNLFASLPKPIRMMIVVWLGLLALAGPVLLFFGTLISLGGSLVTLLGGLGVTLPMIATALGAVGTVLFGTVIPALIAVVTAAAPIILTVLAIAAVVYLLYLAWKKNLFGIQDLVHKSAEGYKQAWGRFTEWLKKDTEDTGEEVKGTFSGKFESMFKNISTAWTNFMNWLRNALTQVRTYFTTAFTNVKWGDVGKYILTGLANGLLLGLPNLLAIVVRVAKAVLDQIKKSLGISSPSTEAMKLGAFTAQGFALGMQTMKPDDLARSLTKPFTQNNNSQSQTIVQNFASGLTLTQVRGMIEQNNEQLVNTMVSALSG